MLSQEEWQEWKKQPMTEEWFRALKLLEREIKNNWSNSLFVGDTEYETLARNSNAIGRIQVLKLLQEMNAEDIKEVIDDSKE